MPSFDVVSEVDLMEVKNAVEQAQKELANRFDFREAKAEIVLGKLARRNVSLKNIEIKDADISPLGHARKELKLKQGLEVDVAKIVVAAIKDTKLKVTTQIQDKQVRVTGKNRDDLQTVITALRAKEFPVALEYTNFRA